jgi:hypothetical protein
VLVTANNDTAFTCQRASDKFLVIGDPKSYRIALINAESMSTYLDVMSKQIDKMKSTIKKQ